MGGCVSYIQNIGCNFVRFQVPTLLAWYLEVVCKNTFLFIHRKYPVGCKGCEEYHDLRQGRKIEGVWKDYIFQCFLALVEAPYWRRRDYAVFFLRMLSNQRRLILILYHFGGQKGGYVAIPVAMVCICFLDDVPLGNHPTTVDRPILPRHKLIFASTSHQYFVTQQVYAMIEGAKMRLKIKDPRVFYLILTVEE